MNQYEKPKLNDSKNTVIQVNRCSDHLMYKTNNAISSQELILLNDLSGYMWGDI